jgi:hypothetical protein
MRGGRWATGNGSLAIRSTSVITRLSIRASGSQVCDDVPTGTRKEYHSRRTNSVCATKAEGLTPSYRYLFIFRTSARGIPVAIIRFPE